MRGFDDALVEIDVQPAGLTREQARNGGFAATHKAGKADDGLEARISHDC
jgi:hypothetical protein